MSIYTYFDVDIYVFRCRHTSVYTCIMKYKTYWSVVTLRRSKTVVHVHLSICLPVHRSICPSIYLSTFPYVYLSMLQKFIGYSSLTDYDIVVFTQSLLNTRNSVLHPCPSPTPYLRPSIQPSQLSSSPPCLPQVYTLLLLLALTARIVRTPLVDDQVLERAGAGVDNVHLVERVDLHVQLALVEVTLHRFLCWRVRV